MHNRKNKINDENHAGGITVKGNLSNGSGDEIEKDVWEKIILDYLNDRISTCGLVDLIGMELVEACDLWYKQRIPAIRTLVTWNLSVRIQSD